MIFKKLKRQLDRNSSALIDHCNLMHLYKTVGVDFLDQIAQNNDANRYMKKHSFQSLILDLTARNILEISSSRELATALENPLLQLANKHFKGGISHTQIGRNSDRFKLFLYKEVYQALLEKARSLNVFKRIKNRALFKQFKDSGFLDDKLFVNIDSTFLELNPSVYPYAQYGFSTATSGLSSGVKLHLGHTLNTGGIGGFCVTGGNCHDTQVFDAVLERTLRNCDPDRALKVVTCFDKAYYQTQRFQRLCALDRGFVTPRKKYSLRSSWIENLKGVEEIDGKMVLDQIIWLKGMKPPLRWIIIDEADAPYELLSNMFDCPAGYVIELYRRRWEIEVLFKEMKQRFGLGTPLGESFKALLVHIYSVLMAYLVLELFKYLRGGPFLKMSMLSLKRKLKYATYFDFSWIAPSLYPLMTITLLSEEGDFMHH